MLLGAYPIRRDRALVSERYARVCEAFPLLSARADDKAGRDAASNALKCMKKDGTVAKLAVKWFGFQPGADDAAVKIAPGTGVPGTEGYDPTPVTPKCA